MGKPRSGHDIDLWRSLFLNPKRRLKRSSLMKPDEYREWKNLTDTVPAFRATSATEKQPMSFTSSLVIAERFANMYHRSVVTVEIPKKCIAGYFLRRHEFEYLVPESYSVARQVEHAS